MLPNALPSLRSDSMSRKPVGNQIGPAPVRVAPLEPAPPTRPARSRRAGRRTRTGAPRGPSRGCGCRSPRGTRPGPRAARSCGGAGPGSTIVRTCVTSPSRSTVWTTPLDQVAAVLQEPVEVRPELLERLDPLLLQPLDGEQRDQARPSSGPGTCGNGRRGSAARRRRSRPPRPRAGSRGCPCASSPRRRRRSAGRTSVASAS